MTNYIEPLVQESTPSIIADKLRKAIGHGELKPGTQLGEAELARKLGVSRGPLREGMQRLTQEGLLIAIRNRGLFVVDMTPDDVRDMYLAREAIERAAARKILAGDHRTAGRVLLGLVDQMAAATDPAEVGEVDIAFHERLVALAAQPAPVPHAPDLHHRDAHVHPRPGGDLLGRRRPGGGTPRPRPSHPVRRPLRTDTLLIAHMDDAITRLTSKP